MQYGRIVDGRLVVGTLRELFPDTLFPANGPNSDFHAEMGLLPVATDRAFDETKQRLVPCEPYVENGIVFFIAVAPLTMNPSDGVTISCPL